MCISFVFFFSNLYRVCACIFNSLGICAQVALVFLTNEEVFGVKSTGENNSLRSVYLNFSNLIF